MNFDEIRKYWEDRAALDSSAQSTTQDFYLREIEFNALSDRIKKYTPKSVADVGCGDGRTTARLGEVNPDAVFSGFDYSLFMVENARKALCLKESSNVEFHQHDILDNLKSVFDLVYTTRCLINLPSWDLQKRAIGNIHSALNPGGVFLMVENFVDGQENFNQVRRSYGLPEIPIREHNFFFERDRLLGYVGDKFYIEEEINISSSYYLVSRVIYSKICSEKGCQPDYFDDHHRFGAGLPFSGEFGPVRLIGLRKK